MDIKDLIAQHLDTSSENVVKVVDLHKVWCVVVAGRRATFVSKAKVFAQLNREIKPQTWCLTSEMRRQEGKKWVARIDGLCSKYEFKRTFLAAAKIEWGKYGMKEAEYKIQEPGYYQDSDGDYFKASIIDGAIDCEICSKLEVLARFGAAKV